MMTNFCQLKSNQKRRVDSPYQRNVILNRFEKFKFARTTITQKRVERNWMECQEYPSDMKFELQDIQ